MSSNPRQQHQPWRSLERHYCKVCNVWLGGDRQSVLLHESGRKHKENLEKSLQTKRDNKLAQERRRKEMEETLRAVNRAGMAGYAQDIEQYGAEGLQETGRREETRSVAAAAAADSGAKRAAVRHDKEFKNEKKAWEESRKKKKKRSLEDGEDSDAPKNAKATKTTKKKLGLDEGHYTIGETTYLEGVTFLSVLEDEMPIQIWVGSLQASMIEKRLPEKAYQWRNGLVVKIRRSSEETETGKVIDVAYLKDSNDAAETLEKSVAPHRVRVVLGADESIPKTLEEARLAVLGGEVVKVQQPADELAVDENTGFSSWGTVEIRKTTVRNELKEERERLRQQRREAAERQEQERRKAEERKMEEAKVENADDSALGAYDVWTNGKAGYKGFDISRETKVEAAAESALSDGKKVEFKKKKAGFKKGKGKDKKQNRRTTSADDL